MMHFLFRLPLLATVSVIASQCDLSPRPGQMTGEVTGITCANFSLADTTIGQCVLQCHIRDDCRVAYQSCEESSCDCVLCHGVHAIDFTRHDTTFYLKGSTVVTDAAVPPYQKWSIPGGGLSVGRVIRVRTVLSSKKLNLILAQSNRDIALLIITDLTSQTVLRQNRVGSRYGHAENNVPYFNFTAGQEVEVVVIVREDKYLVYFDSLEFFSFAHRNSDLETIVFFEVNGSGSMGRIQSLYIS
ncbi:galectin [Elysia marginata]|uniref:Galectin n=1 Tax=Elysia marginata TaxID=1093978 RepID=A0AAV4FVM3_9GAST|nr:galectin [Elysia marginata]